MSAPPELDGTEFKPLEVKVTSSFEEALKSFKTLVQKSKILSDVKAKQSYEKPSEKKRRKKREAVERKRLADLREQQMASGEWEQKQKKQDKKRQHRRNTANYDD